MAIRGLKEGVKDRLEASRKGALALFREFVIERFNTPKKAVITTVVLGFSVATTWWGIHESREAKAQSGALKAKVNRLEKEVGSLREKIRELDDKFNAGAKPPSGPSFGPLPPRIVGGAPVPRR
jgi:hypothetical protein